jgi:cytochrome P450
VSAALDSRLPQKARNFRLYRSLPRLLRDPMREVEEIGRLSSGEIVRVDFGVFRAYVASHPDHVQHILRDNAGNFRRDGTFWRPLHRLFGDSILGEGPDWELSRRSLQPVLTTRHITAVADRIASSIDRSIDALAGKARAGRPIDARAEIGTIITRAVLKVFFGDKISEEDKDRLVPAFEKIAMAIAFRFLLPFLPESMPVPGDRAMRAGVQEMDAVLFSLIREHRGRTDESVDFFTALCHARNADGAEVTDRWVRNNLLAMFATATETTVNALTWLWPLLDSHPAVAARLYDEIDRVVGRGPAGPAHLAKLTYTGQVVQELLRLYPVGWLFPRHAVAPAELGGVVIGAGDTVLLSPFLTHRLESFWERPREFDPGRFDPERSGRGPGGRRHRYSYFPFGGGSHQCIGMHVFNVEAELIIAGILSRFRPVSCSPVPESPRIGATLRPRGEVAMTLRPI